MSSCAVYVETYPKGEPFPFIVVCEACGRCWPFANDVFAGLWVLYHRDQHGWRFEPPERREVRP